MTQPIFTIITKWWCKCFDLCFEIVARPWKPEELRYRRMICTVRLVPWKITGSERYFLSKSNPPKKTYKELRPWLAERTRWCWETYTVLYGITPAWPEGAIDYLEENFAEILASAPASNMTIEAFRLSNEVGDKHVPRHLLAERVGAPNDANLLLSNLEALERWLRGTYILELIVPFVVARRAGEINGIVKKWRREKWESEDADKIKSIESKSVEELDLSVRTYNCFKNGNIQDVGTILRTKEDQLLRIKNFGRKSLNEVKEVVRGIDPILRVGMLAGD